MECVTLLVKGAVTIAEIYVRNFPDDLYDAIKALATQEKRSLSAQVRDLLENILKDRMLLRGLKRPGNAEDPSPPIDRER